MITIKFVVYKLLCSFIPVYKLLDNLNIFENRVLKSIFIEIPITNVKRCDKYDTTVTEKFTK